MIIIIIIIVIIVVCHFHPSWNGPGQMNLFFFSSVIPIDWGLQHTLNTQIINQNFRRWPKSTRSNLMQRKITIAISAATLVPNFPIWKPTCAFTAERNRLLVHSATTLAIKRAGLKSTLEESLIVANSANIPPQGHIFSKGTWSLIQGKALSPPLLFYIFYLSIYKNI